MDGAGFWRIFWRIILPLSHADHRRALIWQFTNIWNDFLFGVVFSGGATPSRSRWRLNNLVNTSSASRNTTSTWPRRMIAALPTLFVYILAGKYFVRGLTAGAVKG